MAAVRLVLVGRSIGFVNARAKNYEELLCKSCNNDKKLKTYTCHDIQVYHVIVECPGYNKMREKDLRFLLSKSRAELSADKPFKLTTE